jgi:hypothetical protein
MDMRFRDGPAIFHSKDGIKYPYAFLFIALIRTLDRMEILKC